MRLFICDVVDYDYEGEQYRHYFTSAEERERFIFNSITSFDLRTKDGILVRHYRDDYNLLVEIETDNLPGEQVIQEEWVSRPRTWGVEL